MNRKSVDQLRLWEQDHVWHPCTQASDLESHPAELVVKGRGVWLWTAGGRKILDAVSSWWVNLFGHADRRIRSAVGKQLKKLEHVIFANYTHEPAIRLARGLAGLFPGLNRVFFSDNGSTAVEVSLKMSYQFWRQSGKPERDTFIYIKGAYHGETLGALSVGSLGLYKQVFERLLFGAVEAEGPDCFRCPFGKTRENCAAECFAGTEKKIDEIAGRLAGVIVEPILQCASGMNIYPPVYLRKLRAATRDRNVHLICDEVASGFGRTGKMMASQHAEIAPDFAVLSKGLTGGFLPLGATLAGEEVFKAFYGPYESGKAFMHSHSYTGNPLSCAAGCAVLRIFKDPAIFGMIDAKGKMIRKELEVLKDHENTGEIRQIGMVAAIELVKDRGSKTPFTPSLRLGYRIYREAERNGVLLRNLGDVIYFMPPYSINRFEIKFMVKTAAAAIRSVLKSQG